MTMTNLLKAIFDWTGYATTKGRESRGSGIMRRNSPNCYFVGLKNTITFKLKL